jgi:hypothetical protein
MLERSELHIILIEQLKKQSHKDMVTNDYFISNEEARRVMGILMKINYERQVHVLRELKELGMIERINQQIIKIKGE